MSTLLDWVRWSGSYLIIGGVYYAASKGDPTAAYVFPSLCIIRVIALVYLAFIMNSSWYVKRSALFNLCRFSAEFLLAFALLSTGSVALAIVGLLALAVYELGRIRISPIELI